MLGARKKKLPVGSQNKHATRSWSSPLTQVNRASRSAAVHP